MIRNIRRSVHLLDRRLRRRWLRLIPWAAGSAVWEVITTVGMLALIRLIADPEAGARSRSAKMLRQALGPRWGADFASNSGEFAVSFAVLLAVAYLLKSAWRLAETWKQQRCATDTASLVSAGLLKRYLSAPYAFHLRRNSAEMLQNLTESSYQVAWVVLQSAVAIISEALVIAGILSVMLWQLPGAAIGAAVVTGSIAGLMLWITMRRHTAWGRQLHRTGIRQFKMLRQSLAAVKEAKLLAKEDFFVSSYARLRDEAGGVDAIRQTVEVVPRLVVETAFVAALAILIALTRLRPESAANLTFTLGIFAYGGLRLLPSLHQIVYRYNRIGSGETAVEAVWNDWRGLQPSAESTDSVSVETFSHSIVFDAVSFSYEDAPALTNINLVIRRGEAVGIVGATGGGKTTLIDLLLGFLEPSEGCIRVDGHDLRACLRGWQRQIGYVPQSVFLIDDSVRRNIALGLEDHEIDEARVAKALETAQLSDFVKSLPEGLNTRVGERGSNLSGGERQRIAIARALYRHPAVLVFDEATSALDNNTEFALTRALESVRANTTLVLIAHRLSTVRMCDRLIFLRNGTVDDTGSYDDLLQRNAEFRRMAAAGNSSTSLRISS